MVLGFAILALELRIVKQTLCCEKPGRPWAWPDGFVKALGALKTTKKEMKSINLKSETTSMTRRRVEALPSSQP